MTVKEIVVTGKLAGSLDPLDQRVLALETKLLSLDISVDGKIRGTKPISSRANGKMPANVGYKNFSNGTFILAPEGQETVVVLGQI